MINNLILSDFVRGDFWRRKIFGKPRADFHMRYFTNVFPPGSLMRNVIKHDNLREKPGQQLDPLLFLMHVQTAKKIHSFQKLKSFPLLFPVLVKIAPFHIKLSEIKLRFAFIQKKLTCIRRVWSIRRVQGDILGSTQLQKERKKKLLISKKCEKMPFGIFFSRLPNKCKNILTAAAPCL